LFTFREKPVKRDLDIHLVDKEDMMYSLVAALIVIVDAVW
jgi:hypothetical protein